MTFSPTILQPGDTLLYFSHDLLDWIIAVKTWTPVAHVEIYVGDGMSIASRNGIGVNHYPLRNQGLAYVLRPNVLFNLERGMEFFRSVQGEKYDWLGLLCFTLAVKQGSLDRMFCSEFWTRFIRKCGIEVFNPEWDADKVPPAFCLVTPTHDVIWKSSP
jgi:hypothetical protein